MHTEKQYEQLYSKLLTYAERLHAANKRRIRRGLIWLLILPLLLGFILIVTDADKIVFLIVWVFCMFALCCYLITVEYVDNEVQKAIADVTETEAQFDTLLPQSELLHARLSERMHVKAPEKTPEEGAKGNDGAEKEAKDA